MTHLRIELNGITEDVSSSVISKLYEIVHTGVDASSNLQGRLHCPISYRAYVNYLTTEYPDLYISVDDYAIPFEDPNMVTYLNSLGVGSNGMITENLAAAATVVANSANTQVTKFNELRYFTNITQSKEGWTGYSSGYTSFYGWTALEEIDISNFTSLGHVNGSGWEDTFAECTSLKKVTASDKLSKIGYNAFFSCANLEQIIGLSGNITLSSNAFYNCSKLTDSSIENVTFDFAYDNNYVKGDAAFANTKFTTIALSQTVTEIPLQVFYDCTELETVTSLGSNVTKYRLQCFLGCSKFAGPIDFTNVTHIGANAFRDSGLTGAVDLQNILVIDLGGNFDNTKITSVNYRGNNPANFCGSFENCKDLVTASGMQNLTSLTNTMFRGCTALLSVDIDWSTVGNHTVNYLMFMGCTALASIDLTGATTINQQAFAGCTALTSVTGSSILSIGSSAFSECSSLTYVKLHDSVQTINNYAFEKTKMLTFICLATTPPALGTGVFRQLVSGADLKIYVPDNVVNDYKTAAGWSDYAAVIKGTSEIPT